MRKIHQTLPNNSLKETTENMKNIVGHFVNLARAYEIALLGDFSLQIVFKKDYTSGFEDYKVIKEFYQKVKFSHKGDLLVEIDKPQLNDGIRYEDIEKIHQRVEAARKNKKPEQFKNDACNVLLQTAANRLTFSIEQNDKTIEVAKVISQLDGSSTIEPPHIAEAIQYQIPFYLNDEFCNAENATVNFGSGISIALHDLEQEDIKKAIEHLQKRLV